MFNVTPPHLWKAAYAIFCELRRWCGTPIEIAQKGLLERREYDLISRFLRGAESIVRALLFMQAVDLCVAGNLPAPKPRKPRARAPRQRRASARVCFRMFDPQPPKDRCGGGMSRDTLWKPTRYYETNPLALRAEAVLRVFNDPAPYVRRLARKLRADARAALRINACGRMHPGVVATPLWMEVRDAFAAAAARLPDSS